MKTSLTYNGYKLIGYSIFKDGKFIAKSLAPAYGDSMAWFKAEISSIEHSNKL